MKKWPKLMKILQKQDIVNVLSPKNVHRRKQNLMHHIDMRDAENISLLFHDSKRNW